MSVKKVIEKNGLIRYVRTKEPKAEEDPAPKEWRDQEIIRLKALVELLGNRIKQQEQEQQSKPVQKEAPVDGAVMAVNAASTYDCYY